MLSRFFDNRQPISRRVTKRTTLDIRGYVNGDYKQIPTYVYRDGVHGFICKGTNFLFEISHDKRAIALAWLFVSSIQSLYSMYLLANENAPLAFRARYSRGRVCRGFASSCSEIFRQNRIAERISTCFRILFFRVYDTHIHTRQPYVNKGIPSGTWFVRSNIGGNDV